eukprot:TRINITY_DN225_c0_g1_i1.p1 TRINITY_DN225_c0_g1~~TRINITY_DN225_c0_g1_i1.p1  ORF type:complete len:196 (+),score=34.83 TRINITY_DN225_c0_g1_i1:81-590(+)
MVSRFGLGRENAGGSTTDNVASVLERALGDITNVVASFPSENYNGNYQQKRGPHPVFNGAEKPRRMLELRAARPLNEMGEEAPMSTQAALELAIDATLDALVCGGLDSEWTSCLTCRLRSVEEIEPVRLVLERHGWTRGQFGSPPNRDSLLGDFRRSAQPKYRPQIGGA